MRRQFVTSPRMQFAASVAGSTGSDAPPGRPLAQPVHSGSELGDGARRLGGPAVTTGRMRGEGAVDQAEVGVADAAERDLDQAPRRGRVPVFGNIFHRKWFWSRRKNARPAWCQPFRNATIGLCAGCSGCTPISEWSLRDVLAARRPDNLVEQSRKNPDGQARGVRVRR